MSDQRVGAAFRAVRIRRGWRQLDVAVRAGVSRTQVSLIERGHLDRTTIHAVRRVAAVLDIRVDLIARWRGGELDRLLSSAHADLQGVVAAWLVSLGWTVLPEVTFAYYGERGVIDLLAWHAATRTLLVIEIKTEIVDVPDLLGVMDRKVRLVPRVARDRGLNPAMIASWLVVAESSANRQRAARFSELLASAFPQRGVEMRRWLAAPKGRVAGLSFFRSDRPGNDKQRSQTPKRVRVGSSRSAHDRSGR